MKLHSAIRFADERIKKSFYELESGAFEEKEIFKFVNQAMDNLEEDAYAGIQIPKRLIPQIYITRYNVTNL